MTLKLFVLIPSCYMPSYIILGPMVPELHNMRIVCLRQLPPHGLPIRFHPSGDIASQGQMSFVGLARSPGPTCLKQTLLRSW